MDIQDFLFSYRAKWPKVKLRNLKHTRTAAVYLSDFRNVILPIFGTRKVEKVNRLIEELKYYIRVEAVNARVETINECASVALNIDSAICRARTTCDSTSTKMATPMDIRNVQGNAHGSLTRAQREQGKKDLKTGACFECHKAGFQPYKCILRESNTEAITDSDNNRNQSEFELREKLVH